jgi:hypothetical protein
MDGIGQLLETVARGNGTKKTAWAIRLYLDNVDRAVTSAALAHEQADDRLVKAQLGQAQRLLRDTGQFAGDREGVDG